MGIQTQQELDFEKQLAHYKNALDGNLEAWKATQATQLVSFKATLDLGQSASKGVFLLNGAGALALLAFMGSSKATDQHIAALATALATYAAGAMSAVLCMGFAYLSQAFFTPATAKGYGSRLFWAGTFFQVSGLGLGIVSAVLFFLGLQRSAAAFVPNFSIWSLFW